MQQFKDTIISQYANSPTLNQLIANMNDYIDPRANLDAFYRLVWDIDSEEISTHGLDIWGRIVGVGRSLVQLPSGDCIGFDEGHNFQPFGQAVFYNAAESSRQRQLADDEYKTLIKIKALSNISATSVPALNKLLGQLFPGRHCYVMDVGDMELLYVFHFFLTANEYALLTQSGIMPKPAGVRVSILQLGDTTQVFGFAESEAGYLPFDSGLFLDSLSSV